MAHPHARVTSLNAILDSRDGLIGRRTWVTACCAAMAVTMFAVPVFDPGSPNLLLWSILLAFTLDPDRLVDIARSRVDRALTGPECLRFAGAPSCG